MVGVESGAVGASSLIFPAAEVPVGLGYAHQKMRDDTQCSVQHPHHTFFPGAQIKLQPL